MRLKVVETGHAPAEKERLEMIGRMLNDAGAGRVNDVARTSMYRPELFGRPWLDALGDAMRAPSDWSAGERELFAAFVSRQNECRF